MEKCIRLTPRLQAVASLVPDCGVLADVGCDHGLLPAYLLESGRIKHAIAADVSAPSLEKAAVLARERALEKRMETRCGDGLQVLAPGEADCVVIAGMGGELMTQLVEAAMETAKRTTLVLQPMTDAPMLRRYLAEKGFCILAEGAAAEGRRTYQCIRTRWDGIVRDPGGLMEQEIGALNLQRGDAAVIRLCATRFRVLSEIRRSMEKGTVDPAEQKRVEILTDALEAYLAEHVTEEM